MLCVLLKLDRHYQNIEFKEKYENQKVVDVVPTCWITYDLKLSMLVSPFPDNLKTKKDRDLLHELVQKKSTPPVSWQKWPVIIRGDASK